VFGYSQATFDFQFDIWTVYGPNRGWNDTNATAFSRVPPEGLLKIAKSGLQLWIYGINFFSCAICQPQIMRKRSLISNLLILWQLIAIKY